MSAATVQTIKRQIALLSPQEQEEIEQCLAAQNSVRLFQTHSPKPLQTKKPSANYVPRGTASTSGMVTVIDTLPAGLTATGLTVLGWGCTFAMLTCTHNDVLAATNGYPDITLTVNVASNAPARVYNQQCALRPNCQPSLLQ